MEIGSLVKIRRPKRNGRALREEERTRYVEIVKIYKNFVLVEHIEGGYKECFKRNEIFMLDDEERKRIENVKKNKQRKMWINNTIYSKDSDRGIQDIEKYE